MPIEFRCTQCDKLLRTPDDTAGKQAKCPECGAILPVPSPAAPAPGKGGGFIPPPEVLYSSPSDGDFDVSTNPEIRITFSVAMNLTTMHGNVLLYQDSNTLSFTMSLSDDGTVLTIKPDQFLQTETLYQLVVNVNVQSKDGSFLKEIWDISFTTGIYSSNPVVEVVYPVNATFGVGITAQVVLASNMPMNEISLQNSILLFKAFPNALYILINQVVSLSFKTA